jgi:hypothetical protein
MVRIGLCVLLVLLTALLGGVRGAGMQPTLAAGTVNIVVSSTGDGGAVSCDGESGCTLRRALEMANANESGDPVVISFDPALFPPAEPGTILVGSSPLPVVKRADVTLDASGAGVHIVGNSQEVGANLNGLVFTGAGSAIRGLTVSHFSGSCISVAGAGSVVGGKSATHEGNRVGDCGAGIALAGDGTRASGNGVGFASDGSAAAVGVGMLVTASNTVIGDEGLGMGEANTIGNAVAGVQVGGAGTAITGVRIARNTIGRDPAGEPAPVNTAVTLRQPSSGTIVDANTIAYAATGIAVAADADGVSVAGNRFVGNIFQSLTGIDLNADGVSNPDDVDDLDGGGNGLLNHPVFTRAVQSRITGSVGESCGGCSVQLYLASHLPGSPNDYGSIPVAGGTMLADSSGGFSFDSPAVTPGQWVTALVTDANGNTSEFGPSARVGAGIAQCGNVTLLPGWNHVGFFGPGPVTLSASFPAETQGVSKVRAIYHLSDGDGGFTQWFSDDAPGRTLDTLLPGEAYWFYANEAVTLNSGFSLSVPLPIQLRAGWNDIVYIGATADVKDALAGIAGDYAGLYQWTPGVVGGHWLAYGDAATPGWVRGFSETQACAAYELFVTGDSVLTPLQP